MRRAALLVLVWSSVAAADTVDAPTQQRAVLRGTSKVTGSIDGDARFPAHTYRASRDGFARITLATQNLADRPRDNGGKPWRPFLRVIVNPSKSRLAEGWSTNGAPEGAATLIVRVARGDEFTIVASLGQNLSKGTPASATYELSVAERAP